MHVLVHPRLMITTTKCETTGMTDERQVWISKLEKYCFYIQDETYLYRSCCRTRTLILLANSTKFSKITLPCT